MNARASIWCLVAVASTVAFVSGGVVLDLVPGPQLLPIRQVEFLTPTGRVVQTGRASGVKVVSDTPLSVARLTVDQGGLRELSWHYDAKVEVTGINPQFASISGVGVFDNGRIISSQLSLSAYAEACASCVTDTDLRHYTFHDILKPGPPDAGVPDYDLIFELGLLQNDCLLVAERWGNSNFLLTALDAGGRPYEAANRLRVGGPGGAFGVGYQVYDWNTGFAAAGNVPSQAQALSVFPVSRFFENTGLPAGPVFGLRIDNDGEADFKIMPVSGNSFDDNPRNPQPMPEPSGAAISAIGLLLWLMRRRR